MEAIKKHTMALVSFVVTLMLTLAAEFVLNLSPEGTYLTFVVGTSITLAVTLLEKNYEKCRVTRSVLQTHKFEPSVRFIT